MYTNVKNVPAYATDYRFWVVREFDNELWFYGAWETKESAERVARAEYGLVVENEG